MTDTLRTRIAAVIAKHYPGMDYDGVDGDCSGCNFYLHRDPGWEWEKHAGHMADAVIRELDGQLIDFALWLSEELRGEPLSRIDAESCLQEWKWLNDESRWLKGEGDD